MQDYLKIAGFLFLACGLLAILAFWAISGTYPANRVLFISFAVGGVFFGVGLLYAGVMLENVSAIRECQERQTEIIEKLYANTAAGKAERN